MKRYRNIAVFRVKEQEVNLICAAYGEQGFTVATVVEDLPNAQYTIFFTSEEHTSRNT